ncbi:MAG: MFS transporter [Austwickia sp.]|jgi:MFS family permease|nr:MAG: MFS transporter [Austwickia sp.]
MLSCHHTWAKVSGGFQRVDLRSVFADTRPLRTAHFRRLWTANIITVIGAQLTVVAVPAQIYAITGSSGYVGLTGLFGLVPLVIFGLYGGALVDHMDRRTLLLLTTVGLIATAGGFWAQAAAGLNNVWVLLGLFSVQQAFFAVNQPTRSAILPLILPTELLPAANSLNFTVMMASGIAGPLVGGALIPVLGYSWLYLLDALSLLATLRAVWLLPPLTRARDAGAEAAGAARAPGVRSVIDGLAYLRDQPILLMSFIVDIIAMVFGMPRALFPEIAQVAFGGPAEGGTAFAVLFAAIPLGAVIGGTLSGWVSRVRRQGRAVVLLICVWGLGVAAFGACVAVAGGAAVPWLGPAVAFLAAAGAADMFSAAFRQSMLQGAAADEVRGRLQGVFTVVVAGGPRVADVVHGGAADRLGAAPVTIGGGLLVIVGVAIAAWRVPAFWRYTPQVEEPAR